ncbi:hypothetical protein PIB30_050299 [Stylosanthes scabra]|uniref:Secreted protein n=1 Tax=Stylosanthes scabra TaxID=79078 RepID=A0ABU6ZGC8_9FABA|nr:hypothetical protein [Stylosanthes scabra]
MWHMNPPFRVQLTFGAGVAWSSCLNFRLPRVTRCHRYNPVVTRTSCALAIYGASDLCPELTNSIGSPLSPGRTCCHQVPKHLCYATVANLVRSWNCHCASRGVGRIALRMLKSNDAYACKLSMRTHLAKVHQEQNQGIRTLPGRVYIQLSVYRVKKALGSRLIPAFLDLPFISSVHAAVYTCVIIRKVFLGL